MTLPTSQNIINAGSSFPAAVFKPTINGAIRQIQAICLVDSAGNELPVSGNALNAYVISDLDEAGTTKYYGFLDPEGNWYILQLTSTAARYIKGTSSYATNWTGRAGLTYDYYNMIF